MLLSDVFVVLVLCLLGWLWWIDRGVKQFAFSKCKKYCEKQDVQLLDDNIQIKQLTFKKNKLGQWRLYRCFSFEFTSTQEQRYPGKLEMLGKTITNIELTPYRF